MTRFFILKLCVCLATFASVTFAPAAFAAQNNQTGAIKGKVREERGASVAGATVTARQGEREVASGVTNAKGEFLVSNLPAGTYTFVFRKPGLRVGTLQNIEVVAGKTRSLRDRLVLPVDEGTLAFVRGSVFDVAGRSVPGATIEIARVGADGTARRLDGRLSDSIGEFSFRLAPERATYRITAKRADAEPITKDVEVDGALVYRLALTLKRRAN